MGLSWLHMWSIANKLKEWVGVDGVRVVRCWCNGEGYRNATHTADNRIVRADSRARAVFSRVRYEWHSHLFLTRSSGQNDSGEIHSSRILTPQYGG